MNSGLDSPTDELLPHDLQEVLKNAKNSHIRFIDLSESLQKRIRLWLVQIQSNLFHTNGETRPDLKCYVFSVISIMAISAVLWGAVWKSGSLDSFLLKEYNALNDWVDQKTVDIEVMNLQFRGVKEKKIRQKTKLAKEAEEKNRGWSAIWGRVLSLPQVGLSNKMSWTVLWGSWTALFMDPFGMMPSLVSQNTKFRMLCLMTLVKVVTYTYDLVKNKCNGIFDVNYRTFIPRITLAMMKSFTHILQRFVREKTVAVGRGTPEIGKTSATTANTTQLSEAKIQLRALKAANDSLQHIAIEDFDELIENPIQFGIKVQDAKVKVDMLTGRLSELVNHELVPVIDIQTSRLRDIMSSEFAGKFNIPGDYFGSNRYSMLDSEHFYNVWITIVETILKSNNIAKATLQQVLTQVKTNDENPQWVQGVPFLTTSHWKKPNFGNLMEPWLKQKSAMESLQKFVKMNILPESTFVISAVEEVLSSTSENNTDADDKGSKISEIHESQPAKYLLEVPVQLLQHANIFNHNDNDELTQQPTGNVGRFFILPEHQTLFANQVKSVEAISEQCGQLGISCYEKVLADTSTMIQSFYKYIENAKSEYLKNIRAIFKRHKFIILLCQTMCRILQYFISNCDAFLLTLKVYTENKEIPYSIFGNVMLDDIWKTKGAFKVLKENLDNFKSLKTSKEFVSFQQAQHSIYAPCSSKQTLKSYVKRSSAAMCGIVHGFATSDPFVEQIVRLFNIPDETKCDQVHQCDTCVCIGESLLSSTSRPNVKYSDIIHPKTEHTIQSLNDVDV